MAGLTAGAAPRPVSASAVSLPTAPRRRAAGCLPLIPLAIALAALGAAVLVPNLYSDPNGLDPYSLRTSAVALGLLALTAASASAARARLVLLSLVTITLSWSAFLGTPTLLSDVGVQQTGDQANLYASAAWFGITALVLIAIRLVRGRGHPRLRLLHLGWRAVAWGVGGIAVFLLITMLIPAGLLGREGLPIPALARDSLWLVPANVLQGAAQELQFRGLLLGSLERVTTPGLANAGQAVVFGLAHLAIVYSGPLAPFVPVTMALGLLLGWVTQRTGSLWPAIAVHAVADVAVFLAVLPGLYGL